MASVGTVTYPTDTTWSVDVTGVTGTTRVDVLSSDGQGLSYAVTFYESHTDDGTIAADAGAGVVGSLSAVSDSTGASDAAVAVYSVEASDSSPTSESAHAVEESPSASDVVDGCAMSDSASALVTYVTQVAMHFLLAASLAVVAIADASADDIASSSDTAVLACVDRIGDAVHASDAGAVALTITAADSGTTSDSVSDAVGSFAGVVDGAGATDSSTTVVWYSSSVVDTCATTDASSETQSFPATVAVTDGCTILESMIVIASIGHADGTIGSDSAQAYLGPLSAVSDGGVAMDGTSVSETITAISPTRPDAIVVTPVRVGLVVQASIVGYYIDAERAGITIRRGVCMRTGRAYQGCDTPVFFPEVKDADGDAIPLSGATLACSARVAGAVVHAESTSVNATAGTAQAIFGRTQTAAWPAGTTVDVDGIVILANGTVYYIGQGRLLVVDPITPT